MHLRGITKSSYLQDQPITLNFISQIKIPREVTVLAIVFYVISKSSYMKFTTNSYIMIYNILGRKRKEETRRGKTTVLSRKLEKTLSLFYVDEYTVRASHY